MEENKYDVIYADPPWGTDKGGGKYKRGADRHYPLMSVAEISALGERVKAVAADDSFLFLWATSLALPHAFGVMNDWGFQYVSNMVWAKPSIGLGHYFRFQHEICLLGKRGRPAYSHRRAVGVKVDRKVVPSVLHARKGRHSAKPVEMYPIIEGFALRGRYLEMFARSDVEREGWDVWGDEVGVTL